MPWGCYSLCCLYFYMVILQDGYNESEFFEDKLYEWVLSATIICFLVYQIYIEVVQSVGVSLKDYLGIYSNYIDLYNYAISVFLIVVQLTELHWPALYIQRLLAAFAVLLTWIKVLDWLRLFEKTSLYIKLITETIFDIGYFMIIFIAVLLMFGNTMYMFELNK